MRAKLGRAVAIYEWDENDTPLYDMLRETRNEEFEDVGKDIKQTEGRVSQRKQL
jgi:hypothetical protein